MQAGTGGGDLGSVVTDSTSIQFEETGESGVRVIVEATEKLVSNIAAAEPPELSFFMEFGIMVGLTLVLWVAGHIGTGPETGVAEGWAWRTACTAVRWA
mmetsp:Transcript_34376/g.80261  ORF Transcript_34376/g.80261 Transcript_34376/m.80261 type:complete len:99 (-) Transcript_34376:164-460(-)